MPPVRWSRRLACQDVEEDGRPSDCFICLTRINVNMHNATATPCCQRRIHRQCYQTHVRTSNTCGHCREPFTVHEAQAMATVANPEPEHLFRKADMELREQATSDPRFRSVVTTRSSQSKDWTGMFKSSNFFWSSVFEPWSKMNHFFSTSVVKIFFTCQLLAAIHSYFWV